MGHQRIGGLRFLVLHVDDARLVRQLPADQMAVDGLEEVVAIRIGISAADVSRRQLDLAAKNLDLLRCSLSKTVLLTCHEQQGVSGTDSSARLLPWGSSSTTDPLTGDQGRRALPHAGRRVTSATEAYSPATIMTTRDNRTP